MCSQSVCLLSLFRSLWQAADVEQWSEQMGQALEGSCADAGVPGRDGKLLELRQREGKHGL